MNPSFVARPAAWCYRQFQVPYPPEVIQFVCDSGLRCGDAIADVGCGTGQLALPLAQRGLRVVAIDPRADMLSELRQHCAELDLVEAITCIQGTGDNLAELLDAPVHSVLFGRSFHLTDRRRTVAECDAVVSRGGTVCIVRASWPSGQPTWIHVGQQVSLRYSVRDPHRAPRPPDCADSDEEILLNSPFSQIEKHLVDLTLHRTLDEVVGLHFAMPDCSPLLLGDNAPNFDRELRSKLLAEHADGLFQEHYRLEIIRARRS